jgi:hypothetical protein
MSDSTPNYPTIEDVIGATPLVRLVRLPGADNAARGNVILGKLEGNNPAGSVKDRPAISMIRAWPLCTDVAASTAALSSSPRPISAELVTRLATT